MNTLKPKLFPILLLFYFISSTFSATAHEIRPGYLEIQQKTAETYQILWKIPAKGTLIPKLKPMFPTGFELSKLSEQNTGESYSITYSGKYTKPLNGEIISIEGLPNTLIDVLVQIRFLDESSYSILLQPDKASTIIPIEPSRLEVFKLYTILGIEHILIGIDHLLFVLGLLLLISGFMPLIKTATAFTVAHSITLALSALGILAVPQAPVEAVIALSIVFLAKEYLTTLQGKTSLTAQYPWLVAFVFGLLHGFGFAGVLQEIGFPQKDIPLALFSFNVGVEIGQVIFILAALGFIWMFRKMPFQFPKWSLKIAPYAMGIVAMFWVFERVAGFF